MTSDQVNALFEATGAAFLALNTWRVWRDKKVRGVSPISVAYFTSWGVWNLFYYPSLDQPWSFTASVAICSANVAYLASLWYWRKA